MNKNKKRYLIAFDMDGTLLNDKKTISFRTRRYLHHLDRQGHVVVLASGRPVRALRRYYDELNLRSPMVCYNGASIENPHDSDFPEKHYSF
ncbi:MAG: HAD-IIB family hydrolase, partial [Firmicutes bacterium]|nr:HAD-IIB family hydrolase [Bacillota bacterium]